VGLGALHPGWTAFERDQGRGVRAEKLDEGLEVLTGLWAGQPFSYQGKHYQVYPVTGEAPPGPPAPVQRPRIKTWVVGAWPRERSMRRAARYDGWLPNYLPTGGDPASRPTPEVLREAVQWLHRERGEQSGPYDVVVEGDSFRMDPAESGAVVYQWADAGANWWIEANWQVEGSLEAYVAERLAAGPPRLS
jgi:alkanesulfonate monooxygenase SsuD/methylene tetrahydromethanopterin reductase-like flavin-dependent oxidoreductase (luciferase family)